MPGNVSNGCVVLKLRTGGVEEKRLKEAEVFLGMGRWMWLFFFLHVNWPD